MAGYMIYSLDWDKFQNFVNNPTDKQLQAFTKWISDQSEGDGEDDDDEEGDEFDDGDRTRDWPSDPEVLRGSVKGRLARADWYGDLSDGGKQTWETAVNYFCEKTANGIGFRVEHDGVYWDLLDLALKQLKVAPDPISPDVALSAFGKRPYRYTPCAKEEASDDEDDDYFDEQPMHSMHTPDEVRQMLKEFKSIAPAIESSKNKQAINDYDALIPVLEKLEKERRMLFVQVDT